MSGSSIRDYNLIYKNRIDPVIGVVYVEYHDRKYNTQFHIDYWIAHKHAFNQLRDGKYVGKQAFLDRFNNLIEDIKCNGFERGREGRKFNVSKYGDECYISDGCHTLSILTYFNMHVEINFKELSSDDKKPGWYPTDINRFKGRGFPIEYCDFTIELFLKKYVKEFSCIILYPHKNNSRLPGDIVKKIHDKILYIKEFDNYNKQFTHNLTSLLYRGNTTWFQGDGFKAKANRCFRYLNKFQIIFLEKMDNRELRDIKAEIRSLYNPEDSPWYHHTVHTTDNQEESNNILQLLNKNTIDYLSNTPRTYIAFSNFKKRFDELKRFCADNNIDTNRICVTSSAVLSVYGIRDCRDIDLFVDKEYTKIFKEGGFDNHNSHTLDSRKWYPNHFEDIIYNPDNYFYFEDIKFCKLSIIRKYKEYRVSNNLWNAAAEDSKDRKDINSISKYDNS